MQETKGKGEHF